MCIEKQKRICHFTCAHEADDVRVFQKECVALAKAGYDVYLVAPNAKTAVVDGVNIIGVPALSMNPIYRLLILSNRVYRSALKVNADVYQFHDIELFKFGLKLKRRGKKVIFDSHENWFGYANGIKWLPNKMKRLISLYLKRIYSNNLRCFDRVITVSPHIVDILSRYSEKVDLITNYPLLSENSLPNVTLNQFLERLNVACYVGTVYEISLQENIIKALSKSVDLKYQIIGNISQEYKSKLLSIYDGSNLEFINFIPHNELEAYYSKSIFGFAIFDYTPNLGGRKGSLGVNKIYEYMAKGLPVICTDFELWKSFVSKYKCGICVDSHDITAITEAINYLSKNRHEAYIMGQNGQKAIRNEFNWDIEAVKYLKIVESL